MRLTLRCSGHCWDWLCAVLIIAELYCMFSVLIIAEIALRCPEQGWDWLCALLNIYEIGCALSWAGLRLAVLCDEHCWDSLYAVLNSVEIGCALSVRDRAEIGCALCTVRNSAEIDCVLSGTVIYQLKLQISLCISNNLAQHLLKKLFFLSRSLEE